MQFTCILQPDPGFQGLPVTHILVIPHSPYLKGNSIFGKSCVSGRIFYPVTVTETLSFLKSYYFVIVKYMIDSV